MSFVKWVLRFKKEQSSWGDLARDVEVDPGVKPEWSTGELEAHIRGQTQWEPVLRTLDEMKLAYKSRKPK